MKPCARPRTEEPPAAGGITVAQLRDHLEKAQAGYFRQIFAEASQKGRFGMDYFDKCLYVGKPHNIINPPLKCYIGSDPIIQAIDAMNRLTRQVSAMATEQKEGCGQVVEAVESIGAVSARSVVPDKPAILALR